MKRNLWSAATERSRGPRAGSPRGVLSGDTALDCLPHISLLAKWLELNPKALPAPLRSAGAFQIRP